MTEGSERLERDVGGERRRVKGRGTEEWRDRRRKEESDREIDNDMPEEPRKLM